MRTLLFVNEKVKRSDSSTRLLFVNEKVIHTDNEFVDEKVNWPSMIKY